MIYLIVLLAALSGSFKYAKSASSLPTSSALRPVSISNLAKKKPAGVSQVSFQVKQMEIGQTKFTPSPTPTPNPVESKQESNNDSKPTWGKAKQIDQYTWTIQVKNDARNATPREIYEALNSYRQKKGKSLLSWDDKLAGFAQDRANFFSSQGKLDSHAGFREYMNQDGFSKLGFNSLGENASFGYTLEGVHLIEWVYAGDKPHDDNQLSSEWSHVGVGASGTATDLIFGGKRR